jgi:putative DNA primase/helicase
MEPKFFYQRQPDGSGGYVKKDDKHTLQGCDTSTLYNLPEVLAAIANGNSILIAEGEKDCDNLVKWDFIATTNFAGAAATAQSPKWTDKNSEWLNGATDVYVFADNDAAGIAHQNAICASLSKLGVNAKVVNLPGLREKGDVSDWIEDGGTFEQLLEILGTAPLWSIKPQELNVVGTQLPITSDPIEVILDASFESAVPYGCELHIRNLTVTNFGKGNLIYTQQRFHTWDGRVWREMDDVDIDGRIIQTFESLQKAGAVKQKTLSSIRGIMRPAVKADGIEFDKPADFISCQNGEIHFVDGKWELREHRRDSYRKTLIPVVYDPLARAPRFEQFLSEMFEGDEDKAERMLCVLQMLGYSLTTNSKYEALLMFQGDGQNGKSQMFFVVQNLAGDKNTAALLPSQYENRFQLAHLHGKLVNIQPELPEGTVLNDAFLKSSTSGDAVTAEHKGRNPFTFRPHATCWFGTNPMPHTRDLSEGFFRKIRFLRLKNAFRHPTHEKWREGDLPPDVDLESKLIAELPGIFNLALDGLASAYASGCIIDPQSSKSAKAEWRKESDQAAQHVAARCRTGVGMISTFASLFNDYKTWATDQGISKKLNSNSYARRLTDLGFDKKDGTSGARMRLGVELDPCKE